MDIKTTKHKRCDTIKMDGRVDSNNAPDLEKVFKSLTDNGRYKIVFDMSDVTFMSSKAWWVLIETQKSCKKLRRGELVLVGVKENIKDSLNLVGMGSYYKMFDDVAEAVGSF